MRFPGPTTLRNGLRVRMRLPHRVDRRAVVDLHARAGLPIDGPTAGSLLRFVPGECVPLCVVGLVGGRETLVGFGVLDPEADDGVGVLLGDERLAPGVSDLMAEQLRDHGRRAA
jgi:hypothetical protein